MSDELFIGYKKEMPGPLARFLRLRMIGLVIAFSIIAVLLVVSQKGFAPSVHEYGEYRAFEGVIRTTPVPALLVARPGNLGRSPAHSRYLLVMPGKWGAQEITKGKDRLRVKLRGSLIYRDQKSMIEVLPDSLEVLDEELVAKLPEPYELGEMTLEGEIVDSKCFLGVMKPGNLKPHRSCAIRCISGGVPPVLVVRDPAGVAEYFVIVGAGGETINEDVLDLVAESVQVTGQVERHDDLLVLKADPSDFLRVSTL